MLTVEPLPFAWLLAGPGRLASGLGLPALMMGVAGAAGRCSGHGDPEPRRGQLLGSDARGHPGCDPQRDTSSAMSFNQVVRRAGFSLGSAAGGFILAASTRPGQVFPADAGYSTAAWAGAGLMVATAGISLTLGRHSGAGRAG